MSRPSPPYSASECPEGDIKKGNDGDMYIVKKGRWVRASNNTKRSVKRSNKRSVKRSNKRTVKRSNKRSVKRSNKEV